MRYRLLIIAATVIWGSSFIILKNTVDDIPPAWILAVRFIAAAIILGAVFAKKRKLYFKKEYVLTGCIFGAALFCAYYAQTIGLTGTTPGKNAFLTAPYCVLVPFFAWIATRKRPRWFNIVAALLALVGIGFVSLNGDLSINWGDGLTLVGAVLYAVHIVLVSTLSKDKDIFVLTMWQFAAAGVLALVVGALFIPMPDWTSIPGMSWLSIGYLAVFCTAIALLFQNVGQKHLPPSSASLLLSLESVFGVAFSVALGAESLTLRIILGFVFIFAGILISEWLPTRLEARKIDQAG